MAYKRKYRKGAKITSLDELVKQECVYCYGRIVQNGWFCSWQVRTAEAYIQRGMVYYAERIGENEN